MFDMVLNTALGRVDAQTVITYSKLTRKTLEQGVKYVQSYRNMFRRHWHRAGVFIFNFEHISLLALVFLWLTLSRQVPAG